MWKSIVGTVAPALATALGGPLAGMAVGAIGKAIGLEDANEEAIAKAVKNASPEQLLAIKKAEQDFKVKLEELDVNLERIHAHDRASARDREVKTGDVWTPRILAALALMGFFALVGFIVSTNMENMSAQQGTLIGTCLGYAVNLAKDAYCYYFGSSKGSEEKNNLLYNSTPKGL